MPDNNEAPIVLMYRAPGREEHQKLTDVMDEIITRLEAIEKKLEELT